MCPTLWYFLELTYLFLELEWNWLDFVVTWLKLFKPNDSTKKLSQMVLIQVTGNPLSFARRSTTWQLFEATDFNGSSDRQCGLCSRNCERQRCVRRNSLHVPNFFELYIIAASKKILPVDCIVSGLSSLLVFLLLV